jgi:hypothetical protein
MSGTREPGEPEPGDAPVRGTPEARPRPSAPDHGPPERGDVTAYVVRPTARNIHLQSGGLIVGGLGTVVGIAQGYGWMSLIPLVMAWPMARHLIDAKRGVMWFTVDARGVYFGEIDDELTTAPAPGGPVPWSWIGSVVVCPVTRIRYRRTDHGHTTETATHTAVGVTRRDAPDREVALYQLFSDYELDRPALERAVGRFGGGVPVLDGPAMTQDNRR